MAATLDMSFKVQTALLKSMSQRVAVGLGSPVGERAAAIMRLGPGSVGDQFAQQATHGEGGIAAWAPAKAFGNRAAPPKTLERSGGLRRGWTGRGPGGIVQVATDRVAVGVDASVFPAVVAQMHGATIRPKRMGKRGRSAMGWFLGMTYGVWLSEERLRRGLVIPARPVAVNLAMSGRVAKLIATYVTTGKLREEPA